MSSLLSLEELRTGKHPVICLYIKGLHKNLPKYNFIWDVGIVVKYLSGITNNFKEKLYAKLATLLVILCGQGAR